MQPKEAIFTASAEILAKQFTVTRLKGPERNPIAQHAMPKKPARIYPRRHMKQMKTKIAYWLMFAK
jgi:hypothetical protein